MVLKIVLFIIFCFVLILGYAKYIELRSIFFPVKEIVFNPEAINLSFEDVYLKTRDDKKINGWFIPYEKAKYTLLFLHGNAGNIGDRLDKINMLRELGLDIFIIDYRGFGRSQGRPSERGMILDAETAYDYLSNRRKISPEKIILYGESLGTVAAVNIASRFPVKAVIIEGGFSSGKDMGRIYYPFIPSFIFSDMLNSLRNMNKVKAAKLFLHSADDEIVPFTLSKKLFDSASSPKVFKELRGSHNDAFLDSKAEYLSAIKSFINEL